MVNFIVHNRFLNSKNLNLSCYQFLKVQNKKAPSFSSNLFFATPRSRPLSHMNWDQCESKSIPQTL